jgi:UDP-N-acetylglucosamine:LPS N-acetylglucosamine transferase
VISVTANEARRAPGERLRAVLVCSNGGHLLQLERLRSWWEHHDRLWVSFRQRDAESVLRDERTVWAFQPTQRNLLNLLRNLRLAWRTLRRERPDVVVSTGAGVAPPFFLVARLLGIRTVFVEVYDRVDSPTLTGRLCYPLSDLFVLQWEEQRRFYPKGHVIGVLL